MKTVATNIKFTQNEKNRIMQAGLRFANGVRVSFCAVCKRLIMQGVERIESDK